VDSARIRLEATEAGWRELAEELTSIAAAVTQPMRVLPPLPAPARVWQFVALALAVLVAVMLPIAIRRSHPPPPPAAAVEPARLTVPRPPPPPIKRHHKKNTRGK